MDGTTFAERMRKAREKKDMGLKELRELVGASQSAMSHYSTGATMPPLDMAVKIADVLGVSLDWLCGKDAYKASGAEHSVGHVARLLVEAVDKNMNEYNQFEPEKVVLSGGRRFLNLFFDNNELVVFFEKKIAYQQMARDNEAAREIFNAWLEGELKKLDAITYDVLPF